MLTKYYALADKQQHFCLIFMYINFSVSRFEKRNQKKRMSVKDSTISTKNISKKRQKDIKEYFKKSCVEGKPLNKRLKADEQDLKEEREEGKVNADDIVANFLFSPSWSHITQNNLNISYAEIFEKKVSKTIFGILESEIEYFTGDLAKVKVFGKIYPIPRQQSAYGDCGIKYKYSGTTVPALPWTNCLEKLRDVVEKLAGVRYNFVLVNRYRDGNDKMGDHKDDEKELDKDVPIASLTFGAERDFIFKHENKKEDVVKIVLKNGMLLLMHHPTNSYWYHGLPPRKRCLEPRINLTFRKIKIE